MGKAKETREALRARLLPQLPTEPSDEMTAWVNKKELLSRNVLIFGRAFVPNAITGVKEQQAECRCSACGDHFYTTWISAGCSRGGYGIFNYTYNETVQSGCRTRCPECGEPVTLRHKGALSNFETIDYVIVGEAAVVDGVPTLLFWRYAKTVERETARTHVAATPLEAYAFQGRICLRYTAWYKFFSSVTYLREWETRARATDEIGYLDPKYFFGRPDRTWQETDLKNAHLGEYLAGSKTGSCSPVTYVMTVCRHPQAENLIVQGVTGIFNELVYANATRSYYTTSLHVPTEGVDWKKRTPSGMLGLDRAELRRLKKEKWTMDDLELYKLGRDAGVDASTERLKQTKFAHYQLKEILRQGADPVRAKDYLNKQNRHRDRVKMGVNELLDYWRMCHVQQLEMTPERRWPQNLNRAHDQLMQLRNVETLEERRQTRLRSYEKEAEQGVPGFRRLAAQYAGYAFADEELCVRIAAEPMELIEEGAKLNHCVASCISRHAEGERCIFFVRRTSTPDEPYYTLELNMRDLRVIRDLGFENHAKTPQVASFETKWLNWIRAGGQKQKGA